MNTNAAAKFEPEGKLLSFPVRHAKEAELLYLSQSDVIAAGVLDMDQAMHAVGEAMMLFAQGKCRQPHKVVLKDGEDANVACEENGRINALFAYVGGDVRAQGMKWIASFPHNRERGLPRASAILVLNCPETGFPLTIMDGTIISAMRTGAVTALGTKHLAPSKAKKIGMIGAGVIARTQVLGLMTAIPEVEQISVYNRTREHAEALVEECVTRWAAPISVADSVQQALTDADVALTITTASDPVMPARYVKPGSLTIQLAGHECEFEVVSQCSKIVVDDWDVLKHRGITTPAVMHRLGMLRDEDIHCSLGELLLGAKCARENDQERIHFAHIGMGISDIALGAQIYRNAREQKLGKRLPLWQEPLWT